MTLDGLQPDLAIAITKLLSVMADLGHPMKVTSTLRTVEEQARLYAQGRTTPGAIVTACDGVTKLSNHQRGHAVDCAFLLNGQPSWAETHPWRLYGELGKALGCRWGGDWPHPDRPHLEWP